MVLRSATLLVALSVVAALALPRSVQRRWVFIHSQLPVAGNLERVIELMERTARVGGNGIVLTEESLSGGRPPTDAEIERADKLKAAAERLGLQIIPTVCGPRAVLRHNVNLVEAMPVRDALFVVRDGVAVHVPDPPRSLANSGFEAGSGAEPTGWTITPGRADIALDNTVRRGGKRSLRLSFSRAAADAGQVVSTNVEQVVEVTPWRQYVLTVWTRNDDFAPAGNFQAWVMATPGSGKPSAPLAFTQWQQGADSAWRANRAVFNSQAYRQITVRLQAWNARGVLRLDDVTLEEVGLLNLVRRSGCPLAVRDGRGDVYEEGKDFEPVADRLLGRSGGAGVYTAYHEPPDGIRLTRDSRIPPDARLRVSYYHCPVVFNGRVATCMTEPGVYDLWRREIRRVKQLLSPRAYFMSHDEIRVVGWCAACQERKLTPGELLAADVRKCYDMIREESPDAEVVAWSDMFDPNHNARANYYLANGTLAGSWEGLPRDVIVANWNYQKRAESLRWFSERGHRQVIAGYYDRPVSDIALWQSAARGVTGIEGMMFTTWQRRYDDLEAFAQRAWAP